MSGKVSELKMWGRGGSFARHRSVACRGRQIAHRAFSRADRKAARLACDAARLGAPEGADVVIAMGEDPDAHVIAYRAIYGEAGRCTCWDCIHGWTAEDEAAYARLDEPDPYSSSYV